MATTTHVSADRIRASARSRVGIRALMIFTLVLGIFSGADGLASADDRCQCKDIDVRCRVTQPTVLVGDEFCVDYEVENTNVMPLEGVEVRVRGCDNIAQPLNVRDMSQVIPRLEPGEVKRFRVCFKAEKPGTCQTVVHAKDKDYFVASGCVCTTQIQGLPALQLEMVDLDARLNPKGIFVEGEEFVYRCVVENDSGTMVTPDLRVRFELPAELEFVSGRAMGGVTVTGRGQEATSSTFVLAPPTEKQVFELRVRVIGVPPRRLVQARAIVTTGGGGGQILAQESESTTLKGAPAR